MPIWVTLCPATNPRTAVKDFCHLYISQNFEKFCFAKNEILLCLRYPLIILNYSVLEFDVFKRGFISNFCPFLRNSVFFQFEA